MFSEPCLASSSLPTYFMLSSGSPVKALDMILELREAVTVDGNETDTASLRDTITSEVLSGPTLLEILRGSTKVSGPGQKAAASLSKRGFVMPRTVARVPPACQESAGSR